MGDAAFLLAVKDTEGIGHRQVMRRRGRLKCLLSQGFAKRGRCVFERFEWGRGFRSVVGEDSGGVETRVGMDPSEDCCGRFGDACRAPSNWVGVYLMV